MKEVAYPHKPEIMYETFRREIRSILDTPLHTLELVTVWDVEYAQVERLEDDIRAYTIMAYL